MQTGNSGDEGVMREAVRKSTFEKIREPQIVDNPGIPAHMDMVMLHSGEIRHCGVRIFEHEDGSKAFEFVMKQSRLRVEQGGDSCPWRSSGVFCERSVVRRFLRSAPCALSDV